MGKVKNKDPTMRITSDGRVYRKGKKYYGNKDSYDGEFLDGMRHGKGAMTFGVGHRYTGEFQRDQYHGFGTFTYGPFRYVHVSVSIYVCMYVSIYLSASMPMLYTFSCMLVCVCLQRPRDRGTFRWTSL